MIKVIDIAQDQWVEFCVDFSRQHRGWLVATSIIEPASRDAALKRPHPHSHLTARDLPFSGLRSLPDGRGLKLLLGDGKLHIDESIPDATSLHVLETDEGAHAGLRIDKRNGSSLLMNFRVAARPESLDGIAESEWS